VSDKCWCGKTGCESGVTPSGSHYTDHTKGSGVGIGERDTRPIVAADIAPIVCLYCGGEVVYGCTQMVAVDCDLDSDWRGIRWAHTRCYDRVNRKKR
jgi:hypothetical protein